MPAVVAVQRIVCPMVGEAHIAVGAGGHPAAVCALVVGCVATPILEENHLVVIPKSLFYCVQQRHGEMPSHQILSTRFCHIHQFYLWEHRQPKSSREFY